MPDRQSLYLLCLLLACLIPGCGPAPTAEADEEPPLRVAVAANAQYAARALADAFTVRSGREVELIVSSSGKLAAQIEAGAPYAVFLSADMEYPRALYEKGLATVRPWVYARGRLAVWTLQPVTGDDPVQWLRDHNGPIAVANPRLAPYGRAAEAWLRQQGIYDLLAPRLVYGESIAQVNQFVQTRAARFGFTALSVVLSPEVDGAGTYAVLPDSLHPPLEQALIITRYGAEQDRAAAQAFVDFILGEEGKAILAEYGYY